MLPTQVVIDSVRKSYPQQADEILACLRYNNTTRSWFFIWAGQKVIVESCGLIRR